MKNFIIRDKEDSDIAFICDSMWRSSKQSLNMATVKQMIYDPKTRIKVACLPNDESVIIGYKINSDTIYVKVAFRNIGVERELESA